MSIRYLPSASRTDLNTGFPQDHRVYIDPRQKKYPSVAGTPTFTTVPSDLEVFPLTESGAASWKGRYPSSTPVVVEEPATIGSTANPRVKFSGRSAIGVWKATTNRVASPSDMSGSSWARANFSPATGEDTFISEIQRSARVFTGDGSGTPDLSQYLTNTPASAGGTSVLSGNGAKSLSFMAYKGSADVVYFDFYDVTTTTYKFRGTITFSTKTVAYTVGAATPQADWYGDNCVYVRAITDSVTAANEHLVEFYLPNNASTTMMIIDPQVEDSTWPTPYANTTRAEGSLKYTITMPAVWSIEFWYASWWTNVNDGQVFFSWSDGTTSNRFQLYHASGTEVGVYDTVNAGTTKAAFTITSGVWNHYKVVFYGVSGYAVYINGTSRFTDTTDISALASTCTTLTIGMAPWGATYEANGTFTDLAIWDTADTSTAHYTAATYWQPSDLMALNRSGSHDLTGGYSKSFLSLPTTFTIEASFKPRFAYDVATDQYLACWYNGANNYFALYYNATDDKFRAEWKDGGTARYLETTAYTATTTLNSWTQIAGTFDLSVATASGSVLYLNRVAEDSAWSGEIDVKASSFPAVTLRAQTTTAFDYSVNYFRIVPSYKATATEIANNLKGVLNEEIVWHFNGHATGRTRCNVTSRTKSLQIRRAVEGMAGQSNANQAQIVLMSPAGQFADDQYAAWDPANEVYNGTSSQKYLQSHVPVEVEYWKSNVPELEFVGRTDDSCFRRYSSIGTLSTVTLRCLDSVGDFKRRMRQKSFAYEDYELANTVTSTSSILHVVADMEAKKEWYNFLANSSFENTTVANSWTVTGGGASITRASGGLLGSYQGDWLCATSSTLLQDITFSGRKKLNKGEAWDYSIYAKSATGGTVTLAIQEIAAGVIVGQTTTSLTTMTTWQKAEIDHVVTTSATDTLRCYLGAASAYTFNLDCAMLIQRSTSLDWFVLNNNDGAAGTESADDADSDTYQDIGYDFEDAMVVHPWYMVQEARPVWDCLADLGTATAARYMGMDAAGTLKYRTVFRTGYTDPDPLFTVSALQSITSVLSLAQANKIRVKGIKIQKDTYFRPVWDAVSSGAFPQGQSSDQISETIANGAYWPDASTYGDVYAAYDEYGVREELASEVLKESMRWMAPKPETPKAPRNSRIIGLKSPYILLKTVESAVASGWTDYSDFTERPDAAKVYLLNGTGASNTVVQCVIFGKPIRSLSGSDGWLHDKFVNYQQIARNGEVVQERSNDLIVTKAQVEKLADYDWKFARTLKHQYEVSDIGFRSYYEPGEWYTLTIGSAGEEEYIDSTVECYDVACSIDANGKAQTRTTFREVEENFKHDSNAYARINASGPYRTRDKRTFIIVASSSYAGYADYYCDGTDDQIEINAAIAEGRKVLLTRGSFNCTSSIGFVSGTDIEGEGDSTILNQRYSGYIVSSVTTATGISVSKLKMLCDTTYASNKGCIYGSSLTNVTIDQCTLMDGTGYVAYLKSCSNVAIMNCVVATKAGWGIYYDGTYGVVSQNYVYGTATSSTNVQGISINDSNGKTHVTGNVVTTLKHSGTATYIYGIYSNSTRGTISGNKVLSLTDYTTGSTDIGILAAGADILVDGNEVNSVTNTSATSTANVYGIYLLNSRISALNNKVTNCSARGIYIASGNNNLVAGNYTYANGLDTGVANTNSHNYYDGGTDTQLG